MIIGFVANLIIIRIFRTNLTFACHNIRRTLFSIFSTLISTNYSFSRVLHLFSLRYIYNGEIHNEIRKNYESTSDHESMRYFRYTVWRNDYTRGNFQSRWKNREILNFTRATAGSNNEIFLIDSGYDAKLDYCPLLCGRAIKPSPLLLS